MLDYCKRFGVKLEPFIQINYNAYLHNTEAFDGKPQRFKEISTTAMSPNCWPRSWTRRRLTPTWPKI